MSSKRSIPKRPDTNEVPKTVQKKITHAQIFDALEKADVPLCKSRNNVRRGDKPLYGMQMGIIKSFGELGQPKKESRASKERPELKKLLFAFGKQQFPNFKFTSISVNKSYQMAKHKDKNNVGESWIIGVGPYKGGELAIWEDPNGKPVLHDIRKGVKFNGALKWHEVKPFTGKRWSLVYYRL